ncbi:TIGR00303 family protein [filamentous cyanobacterium LEGE 11480]|uniref:UPF0284 protein IQ266_01760 n=1 Tax=Romeriopsis navalis LEGE 11480 TaxID=2777977 RepID=A0A928VKW3_9CYAN|nr:TIGR00303 family protein [Romeriopsis navalis]MBE9028481.1 TIGR00303 family protein [Romeriopsis navalis LEGE 11480]
MIRAYTEPAIAAAWLQRYRGASPIFGCVLGFTETALIPGISAAGVTPADRRLTALADAEFLYNGVTNTAPTYPLPPLQAGASPTLISRAIVERLALPICLFDAGLMRPPNVPHHHLDGQVAACVSTGQAMTIDRVQHLFLEGVYWGQQLGQQLSQQSQPGYLVIGECVVGGTTTAQALLTGLGIDAAQRVNSSHPTCNHHQKQKLVAQGLARSGLVLPPAAKFLDYLVLVAAIGDPMQPVVAGMLLTASRYCGVMLAGGTQMLAVYALAQALAAASPPIDWRPEQVVVGTTRWVAEDPTGDTIALAQAIGPVPLLATQLDFSHACFPMLQAYEQGFVKEGVGAGGLAIAASLTAGWTQTQLLRAIEELCDRAQTAEGPAEGA